MTTKEQEWIAKVKQKNQEWLTKAKEKTPRKHNESFDEARLIDALIAVIREDWDTEAELARKAKRIIDATAKPGSTDPDGQLALPGLLAPYDYEPERMVRNDTGEIVENSKARPDFKDADAVRAREHATRVILWADRKQREAQIYAAWALEEVAKGRSILELTWGECIRAKNLLV